MTLANWPDPHPGRCKSFREEWHSDGYVERVRCEEYEHTAHMCRFPAFTHKPVPMVGGIYTFHPEPPKPWVRPENWAGQGDHA